MTQRIEWPEKFVYVCSATQGAIVNTLPVIYAGADRIARIYVLCGASGLDTTDPREIRDAIDPFHRLELFVKDASAHLPCSPEVEPLFGDPQRFATWEEHMRDIREAEQDSGLPIVFALTGGTKPMSIGAMVGAAGAPPDRLRFVFVAGSPLRVEFVEGTRQTDMVRHGRLPLDVFLEAYGVREIEPVIRREREQSYREHETEIAEFAQGYLRDPLKSAPILNNLIRPLFKEKNEFQVGEIGLASVSGADHRKRFRQMFAGLPAMPGFERVAQDQFRVTTPEAGLFLQSGWLEAHIFNRIGKLVRGRNDVEIRANLCLTHDRSDLGEIDLAVYIGDQLHIVEAKTLSFSGPAGQESVGKSLRQIDTLKRLLLAQHGRAWLVNPRETKESATLARGDVIRGARAKGIELVLGSGAIDDLERHISALLD